MLTHIIIIVSHHRLRRLGRLAHGTLHHVRYFFRLLAHRRRGSSFCHRLLIRNTTGILHHSIFFRNPRVNLVLSAITHEIREILDRAGTLVFDWRILCACGIKLDGGEAGDLVGDVVGGGIDLGDGDLGVEIRVLGVELGELLVVGSKTGSRLVDRIDGTSGNTYALQWPHQGA